MLFPLIGLGFVETFFFLVAVVVILVIAFALCLRYPLLESSSN